MTDRATCGFSRAARVALAALALNACAVGQARSAATPDKTGGVTSETWAARRADWRVGPVTYQVFVDRFAPSADLDAKRHLYAAPRTLEAWDVQPTQGEPTTGELLWSHELAFWGGDLESVRGRLDYLQELGVEALYLNPIHLAPSNHKYDAIDLAAISPEYGTREDLRRLADDLHARGMRLVLDGVFNHVGARATWFLEAQADPEGERADWFTFDPKVANGYVGWWGVANLPELNWDAPGVRAAVATAPGSVVRQFLEDGADGWRLDVATELGFENLKLITQTAHAAKPGSLVVGEVWSYPERWGGSLDGVMNFPLRAMLFALVEGRLSGPRFGRALEDMTADASLETLLKSWILLDNHDTPRLATLYPDAADRRFLQALQFTLPGAPLVYYGVEAGMTGGEDPGSRGPMAWDAVGPDNPERAALDRLIAVRAASPALRLGDLRVLEGEALLAFVRLTDRAAETRLVLANPTAAPIRETLVIRDGALMSGDIFEDALTGEAFSVQSGLIRVDVPAKTVRILAPQRWREHTARTGHSPYKHVP